MTENPLNHLTRLDAAAELLLSHICPDCGEGPTTVSSLPGADLPQAVTPRHKRTCVRFEQD